MKALFLLPLCLMFALSTSIVSAGEAPVPPVHGDPACAQISSPALPRALLPDTESFLLSAGPAQPCYRIWLYRPSSDDKSRGVRRTDEAGNSTMAAQSDAPPLLVLLDGNATFALAVSAARLQARLIGPVVIAAVAPANDALFDERQRFRDYTSIAADTWGVPHDQSGHDLPTGGAADFESFIEGPLLNAIAARGPVSLTHRTLFGHSLGGFLVLHDLLTRPHAFSQYFAASPSIWWNDREVLRRSQVLREQLRAGGVPDERLTKVKLVLSAGGDEQRIAPDTTDARRERVQHAAMLDNLRAFEAALQTMPAAGIDTQLKMYPGQNHISYLPAAISDAVTFAARREGAAPE